MNASEQQIERVNYFNGQRLVAADFRADQDYQMAVRRKLNSVLYSVGIVQGLEVTKHPTDTHKVIVSPGVALDFLGREIILLDATDVQAAGTPTANPAAIFGNYLVISYAEQRVLADTDCCDPGGNAPAGKAGGTLAWGAATRIRAEPHLEFTDTFPSARSGLIVLGQVELKKGCTVGEIASGVRRYAVAAKAPTTRPIALEGEKDIDQRNAKTLYFHIDVGVPDFVTLYLRAAPLSTLFYTELGNHTHDNKPLLPHLTVPPHSHTMANITTDIALPDKSLKVMANYYRDVVAIGDDGMFIPHGSSAALIPNFNPQRNPDTPGNTPRDLNEDKTLQIEGSSHSHTITGSTDPVGAVDLTAGHSIAARNAAAGASDLHAHVGVPALSYFNNLKVLYDGQDITIAILTQIAGNYPAWTGIAQLGDGKATSPIVAKSNGTGGTGAIDLDQLGLDFSPGQHSLTFQVIDSSGGQIQYNLYVG